MKCPRCQHENESGAKFCQECAAPLAPACAKCGGRLPPTAKFCPECAHPTGLSAASPPDQGFDSPESYTTPKHLAERILTSKAALEGERKQVTVLFADLKGSMELLADRDPEEARKLLDPVLERMMTAVHRYEGTVNQVMGDGIMALFGAPVAHEDHAVRACYAALDMHAAIRRYAVQVRRSHGVLLQVRVGVNSGEVVVRAIGSDLRMDYTAVGQTTHLAARMEQLAKPDTTLLTADVLGLAEGFVAVTPLGPVPVKGLETPVEVYELTGAGPRRSRLHAAAARGLTRFVGRAGELDQLRQALGRAGNGQGQIVAIVGEPGVGKSRLVWEVTHSHRVHGWLVLQAGSVSYGKATSYLPVIDLLRSYFAIEDRDGPRAVREKLTGRLLTLDRALEGDLTALLSLLEAAADDPAWAALDPSQRRRRTLDAVKRLLLRESQVQPLLVVFEDLHWIDSETQALLDALVESLPAARVLLLVNYRPEYSHAWGSRTYYTQLRLDPLPHEHAAELLGALIGPDTDLAPLKGLLIERTEGNPFFLEESVRSLVETGSLVGERGAYGLARPLPEIQVPATVQAVLAARIDRLSPADRATLQTASVVGKDVPLGLLQAIAGQGEAELSATIGRLQAAEFLYETRIFPDVEYTFKHALTHDVTYGGLLQERRCRLHGQIVEALERLYPDRLGEHVERLAHHAFRAEEWEKAVDYLRQAGAKALGRSANLECATHMERALEALGHLSESSRTMELAVDLRIELWNALAPLGQFARASDVMRDAEGAAERLGDQRRLSRVWALIGNALVFAGRRTESDAISERARAVGEAIGDLVAQIGANTNLGLNAYSAGDYRRAQPFQERILQLIPSGRVRERFGRALLPAVNALSNLAAAQAQRGLFDEAVRHTRAAIALAEEVGHPYSLAVACWNAGRVHTLRGDLAQARPTLSQARSLSKELTIGFLIPAVALELSALAILEGRAYDALSLLPAARAAIRNGLEWWDTLAELRLGEALFAAGRVDEAHVAATRALDLARERGEQGHETWALRLLGEIAADPRVPATDEAEGYYREALALAERLDMRPLAAHCHRGLGTLFGRTASREQADEHLATAAAMYREMGMNFWLEKAEPGVRDRGA
ncbi:MAG TPA: AAA family ATPase [Methylomirabilota bacterium]|nr:AAA family ATPase [Methylomirabilota bacterium]